MLHALYMSNGALRTAELHLIETLPDQVVAAAQGAADLDGVNVDRLIDGLLTSQSLIELDDAFADWPTS